MNPLAPLNCRVVLVRTEVAANLGAVARAMGNFGLSDLVLVDPQANPRDLQARVLSTHGEPILDASRTVATLDEALADCVFTAATSSLIGGLFRLQSVGTPEEILPRLLEHHDAGPIALVFGPEGSGLRNDEISRCHFLMNIPTSPACPALNLAQSVAVCLYELQCCWRQGQAISPRDPPAPFVYLDRAMEQLKRGLEEIRYLRGERAEALMHAVRHLLARAAPTRMEVDLLFGLARQLQWFAQHARAEPHGDSSPPTWSES